MKRNIILFILFSFITILPQEAINSRSIFHTSVMGGTALAEINGSSIIIEGKASVTDNINVKLSLGYSKLYKNLGYNVKTYMHEDFFNKYSLEDYNVEKLEYSVAPITAGIEYFFVRSNVSVYGTFEAGYNSYSFEEIRSSKNYMGTYNTEDEIPSEYRNKVPEIKDDTSFRFAPGAGVTYQLTPGIALDLRYLYNINTNLVNTHQLLVGICI